MSNARPLFAPSPLQPWSREEIEALLAREKYTYQMIALPHGLTTPGQDRTCTADLVFPADLTGKTVLDLGCNHGFFCFEAIRRGAARVVGIDHSPDIIRKARLLADAIGSAVDFQVRDVNTMALRETFDYILCLNLLHHLDNPLLSLRNMMDFARERLVIEAAGLNLFDYFRRLEVVPFFAFLMSFAPVIYVGQIPSKQNGDPGKLKYYFTQRAMKRIFGQASKRFARVESFDSDHKGRYIMVGHRFSAPRSLPAYAP